MVTVLHGSMSRSVGDTNHLNKRVSFKSDVQESVTLLDTKPSFVKIVIISINQEKLIMTCQTELGLRQITQTSILAIEPGLRCTT
jgi:hypothetical protein